MTRQRNADDMGMPVPIPDTPLDPPAREEEKDHSGTSLTEGAAVSVLVHAFATSHAAPSLRHVLDVAAHQTCDLDHFTTAMNIVKGLEAGWLLLVSRANAEAALNDARVWGQWYEYRGANSSEAKSLRTRARMMIGLDVGSGTDSIGEASGINAQERSAQKHSLKSADPVPQTVEQAVTREDANAVDRLIEAVRPAALPEAQGQKPDFSKPPKFPYHAENGTCPVTDGVCEHDCAPFDCRKWDEK